jgi:3-phenylpropionate/trans-cinnamate dioxygenase ferredoxin component
MSDWVRVADTDACPSGKLKGVMANGQAVVLANVDGRLCALEDQCSHEAYPLSDGELDGGNVVCRYHGARFDACSGARKSLPAVRPVKAYAVEVRDDGIYLDLG